MTNWNLEGRNERMSNEIKDGMLELENWLSDPNELGHKPSKIEYTASFEDEDGIKCMVFKYKKSLLGKWLLGIVSESGTFSEMQQYDKNSEIADAKKMLEMLKNYWKEMEKQAFPFDDAPNMATIICCHIMSGEDPILFVAHDNDGMWQFLCGKSHETSDARLVSLQEAFGFDKSIGKLANMPCGYYATRKTIKDKWVVCKQ